MIPKMPFDSPEHLSHSETRNDFLLLGSGRRRRRGWSRSAAPARYFFSFFMTVDRTSFFFARKAVKIQHPGTPQATSSSSLRYYSQAWS